MNDATSTGRIERLWRERPRSRLLLASGWIMAAWVLYSWLSGEIAAGELFTPQRRANLARFVGQELVPYELRGTNWGPAELFSWARDLWVERGWEATSATLWMAVLSIVLAGLFGLLAAPLGALSLSSRDPFLIESGRGGRDASRGPLSFVSALVRIGFVALRAIPEYVWAYLFLAMLGPSAWPAVLALAIHNAGILGRLGSDTVENLERGPLRALRMLGATRPQLVVAGVFPLALPRYLLYFFYRFETCVREATVLGMLGVVSLGYWIVDARARGLYDEMMLLVGMGACLVLLGDLASQLARGSLRRGS